MPRKIIKIREFSPKSFTAGAVKFLKKALKKMKKEKVIIGVSGGVDSAVSMALAEKAVGAKNIIAVYMPCSVSISRKDVEALVKHFKISPKNFLVFDLNDIVMSFFDMMGIGKEEKVRFGNIMARARMIVLFDLIKVYKALVLGTENRAEQFMGYFTRFGDEASDVELIQDLYKNEVWQLAEYLKIPRFIIDKNPTAELWEGQTDENEMGALYEEIDLVLRECSNCETDIKNLSPLLKKISKNTGISAAKAKIILERKNKNKFKLEAPYKFDFD